MRRRAGGQAEKKNPQRQGRLRAFNRAARCDGAVLLAAAVEESTA
jgi:hypothetical protein